MPPVQKKADPPAPKPTTAKPAPPKPAPTKPAAPKATPVIEKKDSAKDGYDYPKPANPLPLPTKPAPVVAKKADDAPKPTYLPPKVAPTTPK